MLFRLPKYPALLLCLLSAFSLTTQAQLIRTTPPVPAEVQILLQLDEVDGTWLVEQSRQNEVPGKPALVNNTVPEEEIQNQLRSLTGTGGLSLYPQVRRYISLFTADKRSHSEAVLGLMKFYAPGIDLVIRRRKLPAFLRFLPAALSSFNTFARGEEHTAGLWRLHYHTALRYGLRVDEVVDERHDPLRATEAALSFLTDLHELYGDWGLAIFAYACGPANLNKAQLRNGGSKNLASIYEYMPMGNRDFFPAYVAHAYLARYHSRWGMQPLNIQAPPSMGSVSVRKPLHKASVVKVLGISDAELRFCNPTLWGNSISTGSRVASLNLPVGFERRFEEERSRIFALENAIRNEPSEAEVAPVVVATPVQPKEKPVPPPRAATPPPGSKALTYTIQPGDNLGAIAREFAVSVNDLQAWNKLGGTMIRAGEKLKVYVPKSQTTAPKASVSVEKPKPVKDFSTYTVKSGDTFWSISQKYPGTNHLEIMEFNQEGSGLQPGQVIRIPNSQ